MYQRILVAVDGSTTSIHALCEALRLAKDQNAQLRLVHVVDESILYRYAAPYSDMGSVVRAWRDGGKEILDRAASMARDEGIAVETQQLTTFNESVPDVILKAARSWPADLIVLGTHGRHGLPHLLLGSVAERVVRGAPMPVLLTRGPGAQEQAA